MCKCDRLQLEDLARRLGVLNQPLRLRLLSLLQAAGGSVCGCELADVLEVPQYTVSRHLKALAGADWVVGEHAGPWVYYTSLPSPLWSALAPYLSPTVEDDRRLRQRLSLREHGRCVVGPGRAGHEQGGR